MHFSIALLLALRAGAVEELAARKVDQGFIAELEAARAAMRKLHPQKGDATTHPVPAPSAAPGVREVSDAPAEVQRPPADPEPPPSSTSTPFPVMPLDQFLWYHMGKPDFKLLKK